MIELVYITLALLASVVVHEAGHALAAIALRLPCHAVASRTPRLRVGIVFGDSSLTRRQEIVVALAGPAANVVFGAISYWLGVPELVLANIVGVANLLPFPRSDGALILGWRSSVVRSAT